MDGKVIYGNLEYTGNDYLWLQNELNRQGIKEVKDVFLAICDFENNLSVYTKNSLKNTHDFFN